jgi:hypothetical protein
MTGHNRQLVQWWPELENTDGEHVRWMLDARCECGDQFDVDGDTVAEVREAHDEWLRTHSE